LIPESVEAGQKIPSAKALVMRDLRVYVDSLNAEMHDAGATFYSRRADGPVYRWLYEEGAGRWHFSRVPLSKFDLRVFCVANWGAVPPSLRTRLGEHYLE
jgi:hypothetical protein